MLTGEVGPNYEAELIDRLPVGGGMYQRMPSRADLITGSRQNLRIAAGYEALLNDWHRLTAANGVLLEVDRAKSKHPTWPTDPFHALAVIGEEFGELQQAVLQCVYEGGDSTAIETEAHQLAATVMRFIERLHQYRFEPCDQLAPLE